MKPLIMVTALILAGCSTPVPVRQVWPEAPAEIMERCPPLKQMENDKGTMRDLLLTVIDNYAAYYHCSTKTQTWQDWYRSQKKIFEEVNR